MNKIPIGLVQINNSFSGQNYLPHSVAVLQSFAQKNLPNPENFDFLSPVYLRTSVEEAFKKISTAEVVFFSTYVWNFEISLALAKKVKEMKPHATVVFGGPQIPNKAEAFLRKNNFIDLVCHGEGERIFTQILSIDLDRAKNRFWDGLPSVSYLSKNAIFFHAPAGERIQNLDEIPSPFLNGVFDRLLEENPKEKWIATWETNRGCPFSCTYCDWGSATQSRVFRFDLDRLKKEVDWFAKNKIEFIFCADANFGMLSRDFEISKYVAQVKKETGYPHALSVQNTKNATDRAYSVQKLLAEGGLNKGVTIALQSTDPLTLKNIKRANISTESYQELQRRFTKDRIETYTDIILGLPGETYETFKKGVSEVIENGQHNRIQFNNLSILPNAEMGNPDVQKKFGLVIVESEIVNIHGSLERTNNEIFEKQELVVATESCGKEDWVRTRAYAWMAALVYFDKLLQIPILSLHANYGISVKDLLAVFVNFDSTRFPNFSYIRSFFHQKAQDIQSGGAEYCASPDWLNIWWPADEYIFIQLSRENKLPSFYLEAEQLFGAFLENKSFSIHPGFLSDTIRLNQSLIKQPFFNSDQTISLEHNVWDIYQAARVRESVPLLTKAHSITIDRSSVQWSSWDIWCREVVWWGNKKGAYLYGNLTQCEQISGHY